MNSTDESQPTNGFASCIESIRNSPGSSDSRSTGRLSARASGEKLKAPR